MALDTYDDLVESISAWSIREGDTAFEARIPELIRLVEVAIQKGSSVLGVPPIRTPEMESEESLTLVDGVADLPDDFLDLRVSSANSSPATNLAPISIGQSIDEYDSNTGSWPAYYKIVGNTITLVPNSGATDIVLNYYAKIPALTQLNQTNWLLTGHPDVYLWGAILYGAFLADDAQRIQQASPFFADAAKGLRRSDYRYSRIIPRRRGFYP